MKAICMNQNLENLLALSDMTLKTPRNNTRLKHNGHGSCLDVIFSNCEIRKIAVVSITVSDHKLVFALAIFSKDDSVKHNVKNRDY